MIPVGQDRHSWQKALVQSGLPSGARLVALTVAVYTDPTGGQGVWLSVPDMSRLTGLKSQATVRRYLKELLLGGWLHRESASGALFLAFPGMLS